MYMYLVNQEHNYVQIIREALSVVSTVQHLHQYLHGHQFILETDHKPLLTILGPKTGIGQRLLPKCSDGHSLSLLTVT